MGELQLLRMAWRNLWRQKRRSLLTLASIGFGFFLSVLMTALQDRSFADFIDTAARLGTGHVTLQHPEYADAPSLARTVDATDALRSEALSSRWVSRAVDRITGQAMLSTATDSFGAIFVAYDPAMETEGTQAFGEVSEGRGFTSPEDRGIVLGATLAHNLGAGLGDKIVYTLVDVNGEIVNGMERVSGIVRTGAPSLDAGLALLPIDTVRRTLGYRPTETTQVAVFLSDARRSLRVADALRGELGPAGPAVLTWDQIQPELRGFIAMKVGGARVMEVIIGLLVAAGIFNTMFMSVMERRRELGIMMALGWSPGQLFRMVMWEAACLALVGMLLGAAITALPYRYLSVHGIDLTEVYAQQPGAQVDIGGVGFSPILRVGIFPENAAFIAIAVVVATLAAGVWPAWKAGRIDPVQSINTG